MRNWELCHIYKFAATSQPAYPRQLHRITCHPVANKQKWGGLPFSTICSFYNVSNCVNLGIIIQRICSL